MGRLREKSSFVLRSRKPATGRTGVSETRREGYDWLCFQLTRLATRNDPGHGLAQVVYADHRDPPFLHLRSDASLKRHDLRLRP